MVTSDMNATIVAYELMSLLHEDAKRREAITKAIREHAGNPVDFCIELILEVAAGHDVLMLDHPNAFNIQQNNLWMSLMTAAWE